MTTPKDTDIREALRRKYSNVPQMKGLTPDLRREWGFAPLCGARATFSGSSKDPSRPLRGERELKRRWLWPLAVSAIAVAASIVIAFILWPNSPAVVEQPVVAEVVEQPVQEVPKTSDYSESSEYSDYSDKSEPSEPVKPKRTYKACKAIEEPQLAQAEKMPEEAEVEMEQEYLPAETDPFLLAAVEAQDIRSRGEHLFHEVVQMINNR